MRRGGRTRLLWIIRCGETEWDAEERLRGDEDLPITAAGEAATREALERAASNPFSAPATIHHPLDQAAVTTATIAREVLGGRPELAGETEGRECGKFCFANPLLLRCKASLGRLHVGPPGKQL